MEKEISQVEDLEYKGFRFVFWIIHWNIYLFQKAM